MKSTLKQITEHAVTHLYGVPTVFIHLLNADVRPEQVASVRCFFSAAATMPLDVATRWQARFGNPIFEGYGLTETSPLASYNHGHIHRPGSIGTPIDNVEMKIVDEGGRERAVGELGEIASKVPM